MNLHYMLFLEVNPIDSNSYFSHRSCYFLDTNARPFFLSSLLQRAYILVHSIADLVIGLEFLSPEQKLDFGEQPDSQGVKSRPYGYSRNLWCFKISFMSLYVCDRHAASFLNIITVVRHSSRTIPAASRTDLSILYFPPTLYYTTCRMSPGS